MNERQLRKLEGYNLSAEERKELEELVEHLTRIATTADRHTFEIRDIWKQLMLAREDCDYLRSIVANLLDEVREMRERLKGVGQN